ncbi:hypothetical protein AK88_05422 [Plasmodium fragile]|uniref:Schizont-infected cell agglutination extracellular alpha domain-containing protein n=1 Tax=Plasmodium fragile TaxID=5857 RepID=A0A0D9QD89_PLAFR|nr:uncharacterized protein AK88_05422 [Plasmodium fragile]KJP84944.1 hypothetical protein AK88_05422 [Plasmodium fragile]
MGSADFAHALAQWVLDAGIYDQHKYEEAVWNKTKEVMAEFVNYMDERFILEYASNCGNAGWNHPDFPTHGDIYFGQTVGDKIVCVLMVGALFFMNEWTIKEMTRQPEDPISESIRQHLRCIIVHMFSAVLDAYVCPSARGTSYAWKSMQGMHSGTGGWAAGLVQEGICGKETFAHGKMRTLDLNAEVKEWLGQNSRLQQAIQRMKGDAECGTKWDSKWKLEDILAPGNTQDTPGSQIVQIVHDLKAGLGEVFTQIATPLQDTLVQRARAQKAPLANDGKNGQTATKAATTPSKAPTVEVCVCGHDGSGRGDEARDDEDEDAEQEDAKAGTDKNKKKEDSSNGQVVTTTPEVPPTKVPEVPKAVVPEKNTPQAGSGPDSKGRNDEGLPDALPQPPSATGGTGGEGQGPGQGPGPGQPPPPSPQQEGSPPGNNSRKEPPASAAGTSGPKVDEDGNKHNPKVDAPTPGEKERKVVESKTAETLLGTAVITTEITTTTYDPTGGVGMDTINKLLQEQEKKEKRTEEASNEPTKSAVVPDTKSTDSAGDSSKTKAADGESRNTENTKVEDHQPGSTGVQDAVVDGGNDDPPPLNPPKPKPNPDQSGSSGSFSDADLADGVGGGEQKGGASGGGGGAAVGGSGGRGADAAVTPDIPSVPPGLTWEDIKPYTPAIIPAVVGIAVIAFFLRNASTLGTSSANGTSQFDMVHGTTVGTTTVSLSDGTDVGKRGQRKFYEGCATGSPATNTMFDNMRRKLQSRDKVNKPQHKKKSVHDGTTGNSCRRGLKKCKRCKMWRRVWLGLIVVATVLYTFLISPAAQSIVQTSLMSQGAQLGLWMLMGTYGAFVLIVIVYCCVLICFCCSKTGKCLLDKIWKKKEKEEAPTETEKNEAEVNKESKKT